MKIAYLLETDLTIQSGILFKLNGQTEYWKKNGHSVKFFSIPSVHEKGPLPTKPLIKVETEAFSHPTAKLFKGSLKNYLNKILVSKRLQRAINKYNPDLIYYRQGIWFPGLIPILKRRKTVMEINTNDLEEIKHESWLRRRIYLYGRNKIINNISGIVAISNELADSYTVFNKPISVVSNGYDYTDLPNIEKKENPNPEIIFVGSSGMPWHGLDKIKRMAEYLPNYIFHIVGSPNFYYSGNNIIQHGYLQKDELFKLYKKVNIGIGSLAMHRNNMNEGSTLKVREYCAFGLPIILGYKDIDLEGQSFVLNIGNHENNVDDNIELIDQFIQKWHNKIIDRKMTEPIISYRYKEETRLKFFESIVN